MYPMKNSFAVPIACVNRTKTSFIALSLSEEGVDGEKEKNEAEKNSWDFQVFAASSRKFRAE